MASVMAARGGKRRLLDGGARRGRDSALLAGQVSRSSPRRLHELCSDAGARSACIRAHGASAVHVLGDSRGAAASIPRSPPSRGRATGSAIAQPNPPVSGGGMRGAFSRRGRSRPRVVRSPDEPPRAHWWAARGLVSDTRDGIPGMPPSGGIQGHGAARLAGAKRRSPPRERRSRQSPAERAARERGRHG